MDLFVLFISFKFSISFSPNLAQCHPSLEMAECLRWLFNKQGEFSRLFREETLFYSLFIYNGAVFQYPEGWATGTVLEFTNRCGLDKERPMENVNRTELGTELNRSATTTTDLADAFIFWR